MMLEKLDFVTKHFLALSALVSSFGAGISIVSVSGYLSAFDKGLLWVVEYPDITKFALIGIGILAASVGVIGFVQDMLNLFESVGKLRYVWIAAMSFSVLNWIIIPSIAVFKTGDYESIWKPLSALLCLILFIILIFSCKDHMVNIKNGYGVSRRNIYTFSVLSLMFLFSLGLAYGMVVKYDDKQKRDIFTRDRSNSKYIYQNSTLIMILSHHTVFESDNKVFVIPSSDVWRIVYRQRN